MPTVPVNAAGWRIEPPVSDAVAPRQKPGRDSRRRAARRPAGHELLRAALGAPRADARPEIARLVGGAHRELVHIELAEHDRARVPKVLRDGRFVGGLEIVQDVRAGGRADALGAVEILDAERDAFERADARFRFGAEPLVQLFRRFHRFIGGHDQKGVERFVAGLDGRKAGFGKLGCLDLLGAQLPGRLGYGEFVQ